MIGRTDECLHETSPRLVRGLRIYFWIAMVVGPPAFAIYGLWVVGEPRAALGGFVMACGIMLLNGYRGVIGLRVYEDRLQIITPLAEPAFPWTRVTIRWTRPISFGVDIRVSGRIWAFVVAPFFGAIRDGVRAAEQQSLRARIPLPQ
jgi:hypothetical protein